MTISKRKVAASVAALALGLSLTACTDDNDGTSTTLGTDLPSTTLGTDTTMAETSTSMADTTSSSGG
jgi:hypothetical protein